jgi:hypothetical protein
LLVVRHEGDRTSRARDCARGIWPKLHDPSRSPNTPSGMMFSFRVNGASSPPG